ncbi:methyltransferase domain-containing protein [bacterium]|nr:methyltransferase domain-containing protein [bacterium]MBU1650587.1 methyltransferase domain-containing protein [bacterium]
MRRHWEAQADHYCQNRSWSDVDQRAFELISQYKRGQILEVGIGPGLIASRVLDQHHDIRWFGSDVSPTFLKNAGELTAAKAILALADARYLPFKPESFDAILEMVTIHHFRRELIPLVIHELADTLKAGGQLISVEDWAAAPQTPREHLAHILQKKRLTSESGEEYHPSEDEWMDWFTHAGLQVTTPERIARPLNFQQFGDLTDTESTRQLAELQDLWEGQTPQTVMSIFICKKE